MIYVDREAKALCDGVEVLPDTRHEVSKETIVNEIKKGKMFGLAVVDIHVPDELKHVFSELQPVFRNTTITKNDIGEHMKRFVEENGVLKSPTRPLIASYWAGKIMLATPLLKWYLNHGLVVTRVHEVVQYKPSRCFYNFMEEVVTARREGDSDPSTKIVSDRSKLIGKRMEIHKCY